MVVLKRFAKKLENLAQIAPLNGQNERNLTISSFWQFKVSEIAVFKRFAKFIENLAQIAPPDGHFSKRVPK